MSRGDWMVLAAILAIALLLRGLRLSELPGGFLVWNEGFYLDLATRVAQQPLFAWFLHPLDVNNPPLYSVIVSLLYRVGAPQVAGARIVSVLAGTASVFITFLLGQALYDKRTGLTAAAFLAVMPGIVLVDHNIQVDPLFVALTLGGIYCYLRAARHGSKRAALVAGALLGLALLTKQAAAVALIGLAVWETWCAAGIGWVKKERAKAAAISFLFVAAPWYLAQFVSGGSGAMFANAGRITNVSASYSASTAAFWGDLLGKELLFMAFPLLGIVSAVGLTWQVARRSSADRLVVVMYSGFIAWYAAFHLHTYYLAPLGAFLAISAAVALRKLPELTRLRETPMAVIALLIVCSMMLGSVLMLSGHKWGRWSPMSIQPKAGGVTTPLYVSPVVYGFLGPATQLVDSRFEVHAPLPDAAPNSELEAAWDSGSDFVLLDVELKSNDANMVAIPWQAPEDTFLRPVLFGYALAQTPQGTPLTQRFAGSTWSAEWVGPLWQFGIDETTVPSSFYIYDRESFRVRDIE